MKVYTSSELAEILNGKLSGEKDIKVSGLGDLEYAENGNVVCIFDDKYQKLPPASLFIVSKSFKLDNKPFIQVENPKKAFINLLNLFNQYKENGKKEFISSSAKIADNAVIGKNCIIKHNAFIAENTVIGNDCIIYPNVYIGENVKIGDNVKLKTNVVVEKGVIIGNNVTIHSGSVIGTDGFGYFKLEGEHKKIPHIGGVIIQDNVEIGSNVCIDRATINNTIIGRGTKIDNLVQIAHNCNIGENTIIVSQAGISGSCKIGENTIIAGQAGISDHVKLGRGSVVLSKTGVSKSFENENNVLFGIPAKPAGKMWKIIAASNKLPEIIKKLKKIESIINKEK
jgi:UDP-3-O-[3-hydroxymyristoyl] glucosamine N-acyltransferase